MEYTLYTPIGEIILKLNTDNSLADISWGEEKTSKNFRYLPKNPNPVVTQLEEFFQGTRKKFAVKYKFPGTPFQQAVWQQIAKIPYGKSISYGDIAIAIGKPKSSRAVGAACGQNPFSIIVPCHRVVGSSGKLTGYGGGVWRKEWLLAFERGQSL